MCHLCGKPMVLKKGRFGPFYGCSDYPTCKGTRRIGKDGKPVPLPEPTGVECPRCHEGELLKRRGRFGRPFYSCSRYPACEYAINDLALVGKEDEGAAQSDEKAAASAKKSTAAQNGKAASSKKSSTTATRGSKAASGSKKKSTSTKNGKNGSGSKTKAASSTKKSEQDKEKEVAVSEESQSWRSSGTARKGSRAKQQQESDSE
jgi:DNA topoisomerase-1